MLPPLSFTGSPSPSSTASSALHSMGNTWAWPSSGGDWTVNVAGSGQAMQAGGSVPLVAWIALGVAVWALLRK